MKVCGLGCMIACVMNASVATGAEIPNLQAPTIPFVLVHRLPTINAKVNGKPVSLFIDIGAYKNLALSKKAMAGANVALTGEAESFKDASGTLFTNPLFKVDRLQLGNLEERDLEGVELGQFKGLTDAPLDGYVGFGLLQNYSIVLDYASGTVAFYPPKVVDKLDRMCGKSRFPIKVANGVTEAMVETDRGNLIFQIDTGASDNVLRPSALSPAPAPELTSVPFSRFSLGAFRNPRIRFPLREFAAPDVDGVLGTTFFEGRTLCIDHSSGLGWLKEGKANW